MEATYLWPSWLSGSYHPTRYALGMQNGSDPRFLQGIATLKVSKSSSWTRSWASFGPL
jgi:hypothetical protein